MHTQAGLLAGSLVVLLLVLGIIFNFWRRVRERREKEPKKIDTETCVINMSYQGKGKEAGAEVAKTQENVEEVVFSLPWMGGQNVEGEIIRPNLD